MIILHDQETCIYTPPKTGSESLHRKAAEIPTAWLVIGPTGQNIDKHCKLVPSETLTYRRLITVRNPYDRLVSLYFHFCRWKHYDGKAAPRFDEFARLVVEGNGPSYIFRQSIADWIGEQFTYSGVLKLESMDDDLLSADLECLTPLPRENASYRRENWREYYTPELYDLVNPWMERDCKLFGYYVETE